MSHHLERTPEGQRDILIKLGVFDSSRRQAGAGNPAEAQATLCQWNLLSVRRLHWYTCDRYSLF